MNEGNKLFTNSLDNVIKLSKSTPIRYAAQGLKYGLYSGSIFCGPILMFGLGNLNAYENKGSDAIPHSFFGLGIVSGAIMLFPVMVSAGCQLGFGYGVYKVLFSQQNQSCVPEPSAPFLSHFTRQKASAYLKNKSPALVALSVTYAAAYQLGKRI